MKAGVKIQRNDSVNGLVSALRRLGWKKGPCVPGAVKHSAGPSESGRHVGVVGLGGKAVHNSSMVKKGCGVLGTTNYPKWTSGGGNGPATCLVAPGHRG